MLIQKLQLLKIPDALETALEYVGAERWICWYLDNEETLLVEDIKSTCFGNSKAWLLFCSYIDNNMKVNQSSTYDYFESLVSTQYPYKEAQEADTKVTKTLSSTNDKEAYLFDRQTRELYSGCLLDIQTLIKQPKTLLMWAELQGKTCNDTNSEEELSLLKPTVEDWALTETLTELEPKKNLVNITLLKLAVVWFGFAVILPVPWASAIHILQSVVSSFSLAQSTDSIEKLKADLALDDQIAKLFGQEQLSKVAKKQKLECKTQTLDK